MTLSKRVLVVFMVLCILVTALSVPAYAIAGIDDAVIIGGGAIVMSMMALWGISTNIGHDVADFGSVMYSAIQEMADNVDTNAQALADWIAVKLNLVNTESTLVTVDTPPVIPFTKTELNTYREHFISFLTAYPGATVGGGGSEITLPIKNTPVTFTVTANMAYDLGATVFQYTTDNQYYAFPVTSIYDTVGYNISVEDEADLLEVGQAFVDAMYTKGITVYSVPVEDIAYSNGKIIDLYTLRVADSFTAEKLTASGRIIGDYTYKGTSVDNAYRFQTFLGSGNTMRYKTWSQIDGVDVPEMTAGVQEYGWLVRSSNKLSAQYVAFLPVKAAYRTSMTGTVQEGYGVVQDGYTALVPVVLSLQYNTYNNANNVRWKVLPSLGFSSTAGSQQQDFLTVPYNTPVTVNAYRGAVAVPTEATTTSAGITIGQNPVDVLPATDVDVKIGVQNPSISDVLDADVVAELEAEGIDVDTPVATETTSPIEPPSGGIEFPTGVFDGIWKYVRHLVQKGADFIGFIGDCLSCMPQELSWCFYGGLVLLMFGAIISKMLL